MYCFENSSGRRIGPAELILGFSLYARWQQTPHQDVPRSFSQSGVPTPATRLPRESPSRGAGRDQATTEPRRSCSGSRSARKSDRTDRYTEPEKGSFYIAPAATDPLTRGWLGSGRELAPAAQTPIQERRR